jgi:hypothetical protein
MTQVRNSVSVINGCGDVESFHASFVIDTASDPSLLLWVQRSIIHSANEEQLHA